MSSMSDRVKALVAWAKRTRVARALTRYGVANGALLSGGIAYSALFSIAAGLTIAYTAFMAALGNNAELRDAVLDGLDEALPGIVATGDGTGGLVSPEQLELSTGTGIAGVVAAVVLLYTATSVMAALRTGIRAMFGIISPKENIVLGKLRDLAGFVGLAASVVLTSAIGIAVGAAGEWVLGLVGLDDSTAGRVTLRVAALLVALAVDTVVVVLLVRVLAGVRPPVRDLWTGALVTGVAAGAIRLLGTSLVGNVDSPLLQSFAALVTLLLWVNLVVRVTLMVAAWTANPPARPEVTDEWVTHRDDRPNYVTLSEERTLAWEHDPLTGRIQPLAPPPEPPYWGGLIGRVRDAWRVLVGRAVPTEPPPDPDRDHEAAREEHAAR